MRKWLGPEIDLMAENEANMTCIVGYGIFKMYLFIFLLMRATEAQSCCSNTKTQHVLDTWTNRIEEMNKLNVCCADFCNMCDFCVPLAKDFFFLSVFEPYGPRILSSSVKQNRTEQQTH